VEEALVPRLEQLEIKTTAAAMADPFAEEQEVEEKKVEEEKVVNENIAKKCEMEKEEKQEVEETKLDSVVEVRGRYSSGESGGSMEEGELRVEDLDISEVGRSEGRREIFYFYQASDGQAVFLHALNVQMLVTEFGGLEHCPTTITASILEKDSSSMTAELRDRLRYLRHLPVAAAFEVAELDISSLVSASTLAIHQAQLEERRRRRGRKMREERRREKRIEVEERRLMGRFPSPMARVESKFHYPAVGEAEDRTEPAAGRSRRSTVGEEEEEEEQEFSFARAAAQRPSQAAAPPLPRSASAPQGWAVLAKGGPGREGRLSESEGELEGYVPPPQATSLGDALAAALAAAPRTAGEGRKKGRRGKGLALLAGPPRPTL